MGTVGASFFPTQNLVYGRFGTAPARFWIGPGLLHKNTITSSCHCELVACKGDWGRDQITFLATYTNEANGANEATSLWLASLTFLANPK